MIRSGLRFFNKFSYTCLAVLHLSECPLGQVASIGTGNVRLFFIYTYPSVLNSPAFSISNLLPGLAEHL